MESETARRRVETIIGHFSAIDNISATAHVFPLNCSGGLTSIKRRCDNSMHFARQDSRSQACFMRPASTEQPASKNSNVPKVRNLQHAVSDYKLPSPEPPRFARTTVEREAPVQFSSRNKMHATKCPGLKKELSPRMDVAESGRKYILLIELPGVSIDDIRVEVDNTNLTVQTTKGRTTAYSLSDSMSSAYYARKILEGPFEIMWPLPFDVNPDSVSAEFLDGLLRITIPKLRVPVW